MLQNFMIACRAKLHDHVAKIPERIHVVYGMYDRRESNYILPLHAEFSYLPIWGPDSNIVCEQKRFTIACAAKLHDHVAKIDDRLIPDMTKIKRPVPMPGPSQFAPSQAFSKTSRGYGRSRPIWSLDL